MWPGYEARFGLASFPVRWEVWLGYEARFGLASFPVHVGVCGLGTRLGLA